MPKGSSLVAAEQRAATAALTASAGRSKIQSSAYDSLTEAEVVHAFSHRYFSDLTHSYTGYSAIVVAAAVIAVRGVLLAVVAE